VLYVLLLIVFETISTMYTFLIQSFLFILYLRIWHLFESNGNVSTRHVHISLCVKNTHFSLREFMTSLYEIRVYANLHGSAFTILFCEIKKSLMRNVKFMPICFVCLFFIHILTYSFLYHCSVYTVARFMGVCYTYI